MYAFLRVIDDIIDSSTSKTAKLEFISITKKFLDEVYQGFPFDCNSLWKLIYQQSDAKIPVNQINWQFYEEKLNVEQLSIFRSFSRIAWCLPHSMLNDTLVGFRMDVEQIPIKNESDLLEYLKYTTEPPALLSFNLYCHKRCEWPDNFGPLTKQLMDGFRYAAIVSFWLFIHIFYIRQLNKF